MRGSHRGERSSQKRRKQLSLTGLVAASLGAMILGGCSSDTGQTRRETTGSTSSTSEALNTSPTIPNFALYAQRSISIGSHDSVSGGDLGIVSTAPAAFGPQLIVSDHVAIDSAHNLFAPSVSLGSHTSVGDVQTNALQNNGATLGVLGAFPSSMPPVPLALTTTAGGGADLSVASHQTTTLNPGQYGALTIADHTAVSLTPGVYSFSSATIADHASISTSGSGVTIQITGSLSIAGLSTLAPSGGSAGALTIDVGGVDATATAPAVSIGSHASLTALIVAPYGTISVADHVSLVGALAAFDIAVSDHSAIQFQSGFSASVAGQVGSQQLSGYTNAPVAGAPIVGPVPPSTQISVGIGLPSIDEAGLTTLANAVSNPSDPNYLQYLTVPQFADRFGASVTDYNSLVAWAEGQGLSAQNYANRLMIDVSGTAAAINQALHVTLIYAIRADGSTFFEADRQPSVNAATTVLRISGLDNYVVTTTGNGSGSGPSGLLQSSDLRAAYIGDCGFGLNGGGQTIGILNGNEFYNPGDIAQYAANTGLTIMGTQEEFLAGDASLLQGAAGIGLELTSDIEMAFALAPAANIALFNTGSNGDSSSYMQMATHTEIHQFTSSYLRGQLDDNENHALAEMAIQGQSFFTASGDSGKYTVDLLDLRDNPYVTLVGGTNLSVSGGVVTSETGWNGSGGGPFSGPPGEPVPYYQSGILPAGDLFRSAPDVSAASTGVYLFIAGTGRSNIGGTSLASPQWAGMMASINQSRANNGMVPVGFANPLLYGVQNIALPSGYRDIISGNSGYPATSGYDLVTGIGSPTCRLLQEIGFPSGAFSPAIEVSVSSNALADPSIGPALCVSGTGFLSSRGGSASISVFGIPDHPGELDLGTAAIQADGTFHFTLSEVDFRSNCDANDLNNTVGFVAGGTTGEIAGATAPSQFWCSQGTLDTYGSCH